MAAEDAAELELLRRARRRRLERRLQSADDVLGEGVVGGADHGDAVHALGLEPLDDHLLHRVGVLVGPRPREHLRHVEGQVVVPAGDDALHERQELLAVLGDDLESLAREEPVALVRARRGGGVERRGARLVAALAALVALLVAGLVEVVVALPLLHRLEEVRVAHVPRVVVGRDELREADAREVLAAELEAQAELERAPLGARRDGAADLRHGHPVDVDVEVRAQAVGQVVQRQPVVARARVEEALRHGLRLGELARDERAEVVLARALRLEHVADGAGDGLAAVALGVGAQVEHLLALPEVAGLAVALLVTRVLEDVELVGRAHELQRVARVAARPLAQEAAFARDAHADEAVDVDEHVDGRQHDATLGLEEGLVRLGLLLELAVLLRGEVLADAVDKVAVLVPLRRDTAAAVHDAAHAAALVVREVDPHLLAEHVRHVVDGDRLALVERDEQRLLPRRAAEDAHGAHLERGLRLVVVGEERAVALDVLRAEAHALAQRRDEGRLHLREHVVGAAHAHVGDRREHGVMQQVRLAVGVVLEEHGGALLVALPVLVSEVALHRLVRGEQHLLVEERDEHGALPRRARALAVDLEVLREVLGERRVG
mmetsp:Transcript_27521/g.85309  ORF Transcript_27521/g.85309 Transcript_27521/m.85309 type:complete len:606 (+) Transcript_27521:1187-3004(+)